MTDSQKSNITWRGILIGGGAAAIGSVLVGVVESAIQFLPGADAPHETALDFFRLFHENPFMGLRDMGLLNIFFNVLSILIFLALYAAHRGHKSQPQATLALITSYLGIGIFFATNRAFSMLTLSQQYAAAETESQRLILEAAGQAMIAVGASHSPGTFLAFSLNDIAGIMIAFVMLRSGVFSKLTAYAGILGFGILLVVEFFTSFFAGVSEIMMLLFMVGGLASMVWSILTAKTLFKLGRAGEKTELRLEQKR